MDYRVDLEVFAGPMDLLLYLIRKEEVDIYDIPIARILDQFIEHLKLFEEIDVDGIGDFLVMASTLMTIKSRMLLPGESVDDEEIEDPRFDLVQKLLEYRRFKEVSEELRERRDAEAERFPRGCVGDASGGDESVTLREANLWDLFAAFSKILKEIQGSGATEVVFDDTPLEIHMDRVLDSLREKREIRFRNLLPLDGDRGVIICVFLAILELIRQARIQVLQDGEFGEILVRLRSDPTLPDPYVDASNPER